VRGFFEVTGWLIGLDIMTIHSINQACRAWGLSV
jgi:hypothetical protein